MYIQVQSPPEELAERYALEQERDRAYETVERFLSNRCVERAELIHEISDELAQLRLNYNDLVKQFKKYEPDFVEPVITPYSINDRMVSNI